MSLEGGGLSARSAEALRQILLTLGRRLKHWSTAASQQHATDSAAEVVEPAAEAGGVGVPLPRSRRVSRCLVRPGDLGRLRERLGRSGHRLRRREFPLSAWLNEEFPVLRGLSVWRQGVEEDISGSRVGIPHGDLHGVQPGVDVHGYPADEVRVTLELLSDDVGLALELFSINLCSPLLEGHRNPKNCRNGDENVDPVCRGPV